MKRIIAGATGFVGSELVQRWLAAGIEVVAVGRSPGKIAHRFGGRVRGLDWNDFKSRGVEEIRSAQAIVNLTGAGIADKRWTPQRKEEILNSRVRATETVAGLCAQLGEASPPLFNAGAIGIYGKQPQKEQGLPEGVDEGDPVAPEDTAELLPRVCRAWEQATAASREANVRVVITRFAVILGKTGGALPRMALPFRMFAGGPVGSGRQPVSWISIDDICRALEFLIEHPDISGPVNMVAPGCITQKQFAKALGKVLKRPSFLPTPAVVLRLVFGELARELLLEGQHVLPGVLLRHGYTFLHPDIDSALAAIYGR